MANRERGEIVVSVDGKDYTLVLSINAIIELEDLMSTPEKEVSYQEVIVQVQESKRQLKYVRALFWAALRDYHPEMSIADTGKFLQALGVENLAAAIGGLAGHATPDPEDVKALGLNESKRPPKAQAGRRGGTGDSSIVTRAVSA